MSDRRHRSGHQYRSSDRASRSTGSSGSQQYVLPSTTYVPAQAYAGSGGRHNSGGSQNQYSSGESGRGRLYDQYGRDHRSTPSGTGSQQSQEVPLAYYPSSNYGSQQGRVDRYFVPGSAVGSTGSGSRRPSTAGVRRPSTAGEGPSYGYSAASSNAQAYSVQQDIDNQPPIKYGPNSLSGEKARDLKRGAVSRFVRRSAGKAKEKLFGKK